MHYLHAVSHLRRSPSANERKLTLPLFRSALFIQNRHHAGLPYQAFSEPILHQGRFAVALPTDTHRLEPPVALLCSHSTRGQ